MQTRRQFIGTLATATAGAALTQSFAATPKQPRWQVGCYTRPWTQFDYRVPLDAIAKAGFKYAGLMTTNSKNKLVISCETTPEEAAAVSNEVKQRGLKVPSIWGGRFKDTAELKRIIDNCVICGCPNLLLGGTNEKQADAYYKIVAECCDYAASKKVGLSVKPHGGNNANGAQCRDLIKKVGHKNFGLWYDPGNIFYYSGGELDPVKDAADVDGIVMGMCIKDFRPPKEVSLTPGTGKVDFAKVLTRLKQGGFTGGALVVECLDPGELPHLQAEAIKARKFVESLTRGL
ncbi:MAG: sugar phosphate isomerase/epimerase [Verrucomicrobia bacterium]|nr:sugar phosphate isomerase/epimerase [Verrucomicrobiota bacterium]